MRALFKGEIDKHGRASSRASSRSRDFALIAEDFTTDNGMLTPSLKLKRRKVIEVYGPLLEGLYAKKARPAETAPAQQECAAQWRVIKGIILQIRNVR